jgi:hypothetical protein
MSTVLSNDLKKELCNELKKLSDDIEKLSSSLSSSKIQKKYNKAMHFVQCNNNPNQFSTRVKTFYNLSHYFSIGSIVFDKNISYNNIECISVECSGIPLITLDEYAIMINCEIDENKLFFGELIHQQFVSDIFAIPSCPNFFVKITMKTLLFNYEPICLTYDIEQYLPAKTQLVIPFKKYTSYKKNDPISFLNKYDYVYIISSCELKSTKLCNNGFVLQYSFEKFEKKCQNKFIYYCDPSNLSHVSIDKMKIVSVVDDDDITVVVQSKYDLFYENGHIAVSP